VSGNWTMRLAGPGRRVSLTLSGMNRVRRVLI
jgi:hypothetical protein